MIYREYGNTGIRLSQLGFGAMRLPNDDEEAVSIMRAAVDGGVNYLDTAFGYGESERRVGLALQDGYRDRVYLSTKNPLPDMSLDGWKQRLEESLRRLQTDHIDFYNVIHSMSYDACENFLVKNKALDMILDYKRQGVIRHIVYSTHDTPDNVKKCIDTGFFEGMTIQYNLLNRSYADAIAYAHEKGMGVVIMGPVGGGMLGAANSTFKNKLGKSYASTPELAIRFVLANPNVTVALSGMGNMAMVEENLRTASNPDPLSEEELKAVDTAVEELRALEKLYCTGCRYCMPCPNGVDIPGNFANFNRYRVYGALQQARQHYGWMKRKDDNKQDSSAGACIQCGACMSKCPQKIDIISQLQEVQKTLDQA
ncbi:MAG: aldo/keto reductase [Abditibacteriota bacterium]|nr:aldo/keto reductase [Abditibacteriota bacterium]